MIDPTSVAFDIDGVIADTMSLFIDIARKEYRLDGVRYEDMTSYCLADCLDMDPALIDAILNRIMAGEYASALQAISGSGGVLTRISGYRTPLLFVTARPHPGPIFNWLCDLVQQAPERVQVVATGTFDGKAKVLIESGIRFFVEDRLETCYLLKEEGIEPVLFRQPWNRESHPFIEVGNWQELENLMAF
jgi:5'(3')-deoxyribonucleotidase